MERVASPFARLTVACVTSLALLCGLIDGCVFDCHSDAGTPAAAHCHTAQKASGTAWQATAACDHQHDFVWFESSTARNESIGKTSAVALGSTHASSIALHAQPVCPDDRVVQRQAAPPGLLIPLRV